MDVNQKGPAHGTALLVASMRGHVRCCELLCAYGAHLGADEPERARYADGH